MRRGLALLPSIGIRPGIRQPDCAAIVRSHVTCGIGAGAGVRRRTPAGYSAISESGWQEMVLSPVTGLTRAGARKKTAPVFNGGQVALVLSRCESLVGGLTAGWPSGAKQSLGGGWPRSYGCSAPVEAAALWGDAAAWAAKLFSINRMCTLLERMRMGFAVSSPEEACCSTALPRATECRR